MSSDVFNCTLKDLRSSVCSSMKVCSKVTLMFTCCLSSLPISFLHKAAFRAFISPFFSRSSISTVFSDSCFSTFALSLFSIADLSPLRASFSSDGMISTCSSVHHSTSSHT
jgi:hypothetical protein